MSEVAIITDGGVEWVDRDSLSVEEQMTADAYLDAVEYMLAPHDHPDRFSAWQVSDFTGAQVAGFTLETDPNVLFIMAHRGELDNVGEWHSL